MSNMNRDSLPNEILYLSPIARIHLNGDEYVKYNAVLDKVDNAYELQKPEIPQFVAKEIPSEPTEALDSYYNPGVYVVPPYSNKVVSWIEGHFDIFLQALVNGFEIQKEPVWVVKGHHGYLTEIEVNNGQPEWRQSFTGDPEDKDIIKFHNEEDAERAEVVVKGGAIEEWSE